MKSLKGHFLIASPELVDPNFHRSVVLMFEHNEQGAAGVVINRSIEATVTEIAEQVFDGPFDWEKPIHLGGPVPGPLMVLHGEAELADQEVLPGLYSTIEADKVREIIRRRVEPSLVVANYAGWGAGQLERELDGESWQVLPASVASVLEDGPPDWERLAEAIQAVSLADFLKIPNVPADPRMN